MVTRPDVVDAGPAVLTEAAAGRASGFVRRRSKLDGAAFAPARGFGWLANPAATLEERAQVAAALGVRISPRGLAAAAGAVVAAEPAAIPLLQRLNGVHVRDSTTIRLADAPAGTWPG
jgi:hypothetical protein